MTKQTWPRISIVTPSYNQARFLEATIKSVIDQQYPQLEYIVIDGGSSDGSVDILSKYEQQITYWHSKRDRGQTDALNQGFARATGDILGWLNSDDMLAKGALFHLAEIYQPGVHWWTGGAGRILLDGKYVSCWSDKVRPVSRRDLLHARVNVNQVSTFWTRELWNRTGACIAPLDLAMDFELWLRFSSYTASTPIHKTLGIFRNHIDAKTGTEPGMKKYREECDRLRLAEYERLGLGRLSRRLRIHFWTRYNLIKSGNFKSIVGRRNIPYV